MDRRQSVALAVEGAARLLEEDWGESLKSEERLRRAIVACALESSDVLEVRIRPEWKPPMKLFPSKPSNPLGGFDLAFRMKGDDGVSVAAETKWSTGTKLDALDETPWDVLNSCTRERFGAFAGRFSSPPLRSLPGRLLSSRRCLTRT